MPAESAWRFTVSTSQRSVGSLGFSMTCAPTMRLADHLDIASEINEPAKPITADITSSALKLIPPVSSTQRSTPSRRRVMLITATTAMLVRMNKKIRFILLPPSSKNYGAQFNTCRPPLRYMGNAPIFFKRAIGGENGKKVSCRLLDGRAALRLSGSARRRTGITSRGESHELRHSRFRGNDGANGLFGI